MSPSLDLACQFASLFELAKELQKSQPSEVAVVLEAVAEHLRSVAPLSLLGVSTLDPLEEFIVPLADGARIELRTMDGRTGLYVLDAAHHDALALMNAAQCEELATGLRRVR